MSLFDALENAGRLSPQAVPEIRYLRAAADRVRERWPDVQVARTEKEREALAQRLRDRVESGDWEGTRLSFVVAAASAVFDAERRERPDLARTRDFLYAEVAASTSETFLSGLLRTYLDSYAPEGAHTTALATALVTAAPRMSATGRLLLDAVPELMDPVSGPDRLAARMSKMSDPYTELLRLGVRNPHGGGFMDLAHLSLTSLVRPHLSERNLIDWYIKWLRPPGKSAGLNTGAEQSIEALIDPWLEKAPADELRSYLVEALIELYGDPRIKSGGVWGAIGERYMAVVHRWLTREDMRFFTGVVDATQKDPMWPPRRDFWLKLYDEGKIDAAWAALSSQAFEYTRQHLMRQDAKNAYTRVGYQQARQNTSLLIMKIGNKIMVDGCHSYRTHVFDIGDPMAPKLFEEGYDCDQIMRASDRRARGASKSHSSIPSWSRWVRDMMNADVPWSQQTRAYTKVFRPRPPKRRYAPPRQPVTGRYTDLQPAVRTFGAANTDQDLFSSTGATRASSGNGLISPVRRAASPPASVAAARRVHPDPLGLVKPTSGDASSLKQTRFASHMDRMIAYGPAAAAAVLAYLEAPEKGRTRPALSPKSREGLAWVRAVKGDPPLRLRNALEYLLLNLKTSGVDLDDLFASAGDPPEVTDQSARHATIPRESSDSSEQKFPPLPDHTDGRLDLLRKNADALEDLGMWQSTFEERKELAIAIKRLRSQSPHLRADQRAKLYALYEKLRLGGKRGRK
ncbi:EH signature domain-containing protein [Jannaschia seohaensis]|uniref:EH signature protein n=1 Tax=Jannaschia seohaensis TaxID=475081 RepID=A0A2Y9AU63_9RHOB|nr:EH signature domain-containing protein [Jannaschia seohaensis]PWJ19365.1 EH signature protein [Jannaschia seohaensis]SSA46027.1 EH_Signature domain-containing protein [Jannaschia seohaensis]